MSNTFSVVIAAVALVVSPVAMAATKCEPTAARDPITINYDDGKHEFHEGLMHRFAFGHGMSPHGASIACKWHVDVQPKDAPKPITVIHGTALDRVLVEQPPGGGRAWLIAKSCGKFERTS